MTGALVVPDVPARLTVTFFQGTYYADRRAPSAPGTGFCRGLELLDCSNDGLIFTAVASLGYLGIFPDYAGISGALSAPGANASALLGAAGPEPPRPSTHSYIQADSYERTFEDMLAAVSSIAGTTDCVQAPDGANVTVHASHKVAALGYSQGGFAAMAVARGVGSGRVTLPDGYDFVGAAPGAGPFDPAATYERPSGVQNYSVPSYIPNLSIGALNERQRLDLVSDVFAAPWDVEVPRLYSGDFTSSQVEEELPKPVDAVFAPGVFEATQAWLAAYVNGSDPAARRELRCARSRAWVPARVSGPARASASARPPPSLPTDPRPRASAAPTRLRRLRATAPRPSALFWRGRPCIPTGSRILRAWRICWTCPSSCATGPMMSRSTTPTR